MKYIIYGAGEDGKQACYDLSWNRVAYFCDVKQAGNFLYKRRIISIEDMLLKYATGNYIIVIASSRYHLEMEMLLKSRGVDKYFVYNRNAFAEVEKHYPYYVLYGKALRMDYTELMMHYRIRRYGHIAISNINLALPYLISEIYFQCEDFRIDYIIDDNVKQTYFYMGIPVVRSCQALANIDCLVINSSCQESNIRDGLPIKPSFDIVDCFDTIKFIPEYRHPELARYKNIHAGKRCFIIGTGPSLRMADLDALDEHEEVSFSVNYIFKCFNKTKWRPTYFVSTDFVASSFPEADIYNYVSREVTDAFYSDPIHWKACAHGIISDRNCVHMDIGDINTDKCMPRFSDDITYGTYDGNTVLYICIQIAYYMGFKEMYLLGADTDYSGDNAKDHFAENYYSKELEDELNYNEPNGMSYEYRYGATWLQSVKNAFRKAELFSRVNGFRIFNATRGGKLEEFERVDFDSLFA